MSKSIKRTVVSTVTKEASTAEYNGWNLNFTTESDGQSVKSVTVYGQKENSYVNASWSDGHSNIGFSQTSHEADAANAIMAEISAIVGV